MFDGALTCSWGVETMAAVVRGTPEEKKQRQIYERFSLPLPDPNKNISLRYVLHLITQDPRAL